MEYLGHLTEIFTFVKWGIPFLMVLAIMPLLISVFSVIQSIFKILETITMTISPSVQGILDGIKTFFTAYFTDLKEGVKVMFTNLNVAILVATCLFGSSYATRVYYKSLVISRDDRIGAVEKEINTLKKQVTVYEALMTKNKIKFK